MDDHELIHEHCSGKRPSAICPAYLQDQQLFPIYCMTPQMTINGELKQLVMIGNGTQYLVCQVNPVTHEVTSNVMPFETFQAGVLYFNAEADGLFTLEEEQHRSSVSGIELSKPSGVVQSREMKTPLWDGCLTVTVEDDRTWKAVCQRTGVTAAEGSEFDENNWTHQVLEVLERKRE